MLDALSSGPMIEQPLMLIQLVETAWGLPHELAGQYVVSYDPDYHLPDGTYDGGNLICTPDPQQATLFRPAEAHAMWTASPKCPCHALRLDGKPNRPLTAFTVRMMTPPQAGAMR